MALMLEPGIDVTVVPNLYDIKPDSTGVLALQRINGDVVVCSWLFPRATHWILDRHGIFGHVGKTLLHADDEGEEEDPDGGDAESQDGENPNAAATNGETRHRVVEKRQIPNRKIYALDLRSSNRAEDFVDEVKRIRNERSRQVVTLGDLLTPAAVQSGDTNGHAEAAPAEPDASASGKVERIEEPAGRRWYPVIDYSRCTNCMECIDFCLFGVYGVDRIDTILVEQPDNCRKGCPACSRVCPENAIIFPQHKTPAIAGSNEAAESMKIDLSQLFGAPTDGKSPLELAALERDEQLLMAGRDAVGMSVGIPKRQVDRDAAPRDELDDLVDQLNNLDL